ncbi:MAG TPA: AAA family ATPase [Streptosporangiaceae bacterium]|nr:AAA family ATPase [Streptosporangiaceae bacterium]
MFPLVARAGVLAEVDAVLTAARAGRGALVTVLGEPGIGKTRLAEAAADLAAARPQAGAGTGRTADFEVIWTWCPAAAGGAPLRPWSRVVRLLAGGHAAAAQLVDGSPFLAALAGRDAAGRDGGAPDPGGARSQLSFDLAEVIAAAAAQRPVLVIIDDAHHADTSSLRLLAELAPALRAMAATVLVTARDSDQDWQGRPAERNALLRSGLVITLPPFGPDDVASLVGAVTGAPPGPDLVAVIAERSGGNPLLATELARQLGRQETSAGQARVLVPDSVRVITRARLDDMTEPTRSVLGSAAVLGARFRRDVLARLAGVPAGDLADALAAGRDARLLEPSGPGEDRFRHELVRDAIYDALPEAVREERHAQAGRVLAELAGRGRDVDDAEAAYHLVRAGPAAAAQAIEYARRAGDRAMAALAFEDAARWYEHVADRLAAGRADDAEQAAAALSLGTARLAAGNPDGGRAGFRQAAERARRARRPDLLARAALGLGGGPAGFEVTLLDGEQISLLEEARDALGGTHDALTALVTARLSIASSLVSGEAERLGLATEAVRLARSAGDDAALAACLAALCDAISGPGHHAERHAYATEIIGIAGRLRDPVLGLLGRRLRLVALLEAGAIADWDADALAYQTAAEALRHPLYAWYVPLWRGMRALAAGRFGECRDALAEAAALGSRAGSRNAGLLVATQQWCLYAEEGDTAGLLGMLPQLDTAPMAGTMVQITRALVLAQVGRTQDARAQLEAVVPLLPALARDSEWLAVVAQVAEILTLTGPSEPHPVARWAYDALAPYAGLFVVEGICAAVRGPVHRHLALLADALGDREAAAAHRAEALAQARALGATALVTRIEREGGESGPPPAGGRPPAGPADHVFRRDGEVWTLRYGGREIRLRDSKGLRDLHALLTRPGTAVAALDLAGATPGQALATPDTGEVLDAQARSAYRQRLHELEEAAAEADAAADIERSARVTAERDALVEALTQAYGLGGRVRRPGSASERARTAVTARIKDAIRRVGEADPELGRHLARSVRTGTFCVYDPDQPARWSG